MSSDSALILAFRRLRFEVAINLFKRFALGALHKTGIPQTRLLLLKLMGSWPGKDKLPISEDTWQSWFSSNPPNPQPGKVQALDTMAGFALSFVRPADRTPLRLPKDFFYELVFGGIASHLLSPSESKFSERLLSVRAMTYSPLSAWHLHLDAIQLGTMVDAFHSVPWETVVQLAANRLLACLDEQWGPRSGKIYSHLSSELRLRWTNANSETRASIAAAYQRMRPNLFEKHLNGGARPNWAIAGVESDAAPEHIYKTLFALAADAEFLVADRLSAWAMDLATAALVTRAKAWTDRYRLFGGVEDEKLFWGAFDEILFRGVTEEDATMIDVAMGRCLSAQWTVASRQVLHRAGQCYRWELASLGLAPDDVRDIAGTSSHIHPLTYVG